MKRLAAFEWIAVAVTAGASLAFAAAARDKLSAPASTPMRFRFAAVDWGAAPDVANPMERPLRLAFVGDIMQHGAQADDDFRRNYAEVADVLQAADIAVGNLEFPVDPQRPVQRQLDSVQFNGSTAHLDAIAAVGFDVLSTANNHCFDQEWEGLRATVDEIRARGMRAVGNLPGDEQEEPVVVERGEWRIGFFAYTFRPNTYRDARDQPAYRDPAWPIHELNFMDWTEEYRAQGLAKVRRHVEAARRARVDLLIALVHWGREWQFQPDAHQRRAGRDLIDAGFQLVVGSHGHVLNPVERYGGGIITYSLGNFSSAFQPLAARLGGVLCVDVERGAAGEAMLAFQGVLPLVVEQRNRRLRWVTPAESQRHAAQQLAERVLGPSLNYRTNFRVVKETP